VNETRIAHVRALLGPDDSLRDHSDT